MSENSRKAEFSSLVVSDCLHFCSYLVSHPLYFSYFLYFTPYIVKLLSFLTPLLVTCALVLLALITSSPSEVLPESLDSQWGILLSTYQLVLEQLGFSGVGKDEEFGCFVQIEAFKVMLETSIFEGLELKSQKDRSQESEEEEEEEAVLSSRQVNGDATAQQGELKEETGSEDDWFETLQDVKPLEAEPKKGEVKKEKSSMKEDSMAVERSKPENNSRAASSFSETNDDLGKVGYSSKAKAASPTHEVAVEGATAEGKPRPRAMEGADLGSFPSMRREKEWRRTLACKLFEERHNVGGVEGMDMLWERYEAEADKIPANGDEKNGKKEEVDSGDEEEDLEGKLCCLQALKFSAGKVNLGMGKPNLAKISKALKGIAWFHHVSKNGKKVRR